LIPGEEIEKIYKEKWEEIYDKFGHYPKFEESLKEIIEKSKLKEKEKCKSCGNEIGHQTKNKLCVKCYGLSIRKVERPSQEELAELLKEHSYCAIGRMYGVSDSSIRKWLK
jgi:effector-binding domain-containing protein